MLNNDGDYANGTLTSWGRIKSVEPPFDPKTNSMPSAVAFRQANTQIQDRRPKSLLANFVERQLGNNAPQDYEYSEHLVEGRYVDLNENEIGFAPQNTASIQQSPSKRHLPPVPTTTTPPNKDRWQTAHQRTSSNAPPRRTFAALDSANNGLAPADLNFLSLPFNVSLE